jgi:hypothetical protein
MSQVTVATMTCVRRLALCERRLHEPGSGRILQVNTTGPALQFYDGHLLDGKTTGVLGGIFDRDAGCVSRPSTIPAPASRAFPFCRTAADRALSLDHEVGVSH